MTTVRNTTQSPEQEVSLYDRVLGNPEARDAYFNTTQAQLFGDPESEIVSDLVKLLESNDVAFLFSPDINLARPLLLVDSDQFVGGEEVRRAIKHFLTSASQDSAA